jgi:hypothetical protein
MCLNTCVATYSKILMMTCDVITAVLFNPSNTELNPICHLLALLGAHHILHVSRTRVKEDTGCMKRGEINPRSSYGNVEYVEK